MTVVNAIHSTSITAALQFSILKFKWKGKKIGIAHSAVSIRQATVSKAEKGHLGGKTHKPEVDEAMKLEAGIPLQVSQIDLIL